MFSTYLTQFRFSKADIENLSAALEVGKRKLRKMLLGEIPCPPEGKAAVLVLCAQKGGLAHAALSDPSSGQWIFVYPVKRTPEEQQAATRAACAVALKFKCRPRGHNGNPENHPQQNLC